MNVDDMVAAIGGEDRRRHVRMSSHTTQSPEA